MRIYSDYKKVFNLGYEIAKELALKKPMFKAKDAAQNSSNAIRAGIALNTFFRKNKPKEQAVFNGFKDELTDYTKYRGKGISM